MRHPFFDRLLAGNRRYLAGETAGIISSAARLETAEHGQHPYAIVVACSDSRVIPEAIFGAGIGNPFFSTDTTAALRAAEIEADVILLAKKVDAVYDSDPELNPDAKKYETLTHQEVLEQDLKVMDATAASICRDNGIVIHVFGLSEPENMIRAVCGEKIGTLIY